MSLPVDLTSLVPLGEAAQRLGMNRERVLRRVQDGAIKGQKVGDRWFVLISSLPADARP